MNARLSEAVAPLGLHYAPDPSSQTACTIGGNVAENAGGPHCLKYGVTTNHVVELEVVLPDGSVIRLGSPHGEAWGPDLVGLFVGSEGMFGIATEITVRLEPMPESVRTLLADFPTVRAASEAVSAIIAAGIVPAALEMMDQACVAAVEAAIYAAGYPTDAAAVLLVELDGQAERGRTPSTPWSSAILRARGARDVRTARRRGRPRAALAGPQEGVRRDGPHRARPRRAGRRGAPLGAARGAGPDRARSATATASFGNVFHAGDGNLHPNICFDRRDPALAGGCSRRAARSWRRASPPAAASPASTASARTSSTTCR